MMQSTDWKKSIERWRQKSVLSGKWSSKTLVLAARKNFLTLSYILFFLILGFSLLIFTFLHSCVFSQTIHKTTIVFAWYGWSQILLTWEGLPIFTILVQKFQLIQFGNKAPSSGKHSILTLLTSVGFKTCIVLSIGFIFYGVEEPRWKLKKTSKCHKQLKNCFPRNKEWIISPLSNFCALPRNEDIEKGW